MLKDRGARTELLQNTDKKVHSSKAAFITAVHGAQFSGLKRLVWLMWSGVITTVATITKPRPSSLSQHLWLEGCAVAFTSAILQQVTPRGTSVCIISSIWPVRVTLGPNLSTTFFEECCVTQLRDHHFGKDMSPNCWFHFWSDSHRDHSLLRDVKKCQTNAAILYSHGCPISAKSQRSPRPLQCYVQVQPHILVKETPTWSTLHTKLCLDAAVVSFKRQWLCECSSLKHSLCPTKPIEFHFPRMA